MIEDPVRARSSSMRDEPITPPSNHPSPRWRRVRHAALGLGWILTLTILVASALWPFSGHAWRLDLILILTLALGAMWAALCRWALLGVALLAIVIQAAALLPGRAPGAPAQGQMSGVPVRLFVLNAYNRLRPATPASAVIDDAEADVLVIVEQGPEVVRLLGSDGFRARYPHTLPAVPRTSKPTIVSRWPLKPVRMTFARSAEGAPNPGMSPTGGIVQRPEGAFLLVATHPASPRSDEAWRDGNEAVRRMIPMLNELRAEHGLPLVVAGDFNSTPTGWRSRALRTQAGLLRAKPFGIGAGTWPGGLRWPARLAIDDAFVSEGVRVAAWSASPAVPGGDHSPVRINLLIPPAAQPAAGSSQSMPQNPSGLP